MTEFTAEECAEQLAEFERGISGAILEGLDIGAKIALKISGTKFFQGGGGPPNPPPGPLKIRTGTLRRGTMIIEPRALPDGTWVTGLENAVSYAKFHEPEPRPFMTPAVEEAKPLTITAIGVELEDLAQRVLG